MTATLAAGFVVLVAIDFAAASSGVVAVAFFWVWFCFCDPVAVAVVAVLLPFLLPFRCRFAVCECGERICWTSRGRSRVEEAFEGLYEVFLLPVKP